MILLRWITFYESLYNLDDVERPIQSVIENDRKLDMWYANYTMHQKKRLLEYHKNNKTPNIDTGIPKARMVVGRNNR